MKKEIIFKKLKYRKHENEIQVEGEKIYKLPAIKEHLGDILLYFYPILQHLDSIGYLWTSICYLHFKQFASMTNQPLSSLTIGRPWKSLTPSYTGTHWAASMTLRVCSSWNFAPGSWHCLLKSVSMNAHSLTCGQTRLRKPPETGHGRREKEETGKTQETMGFTSKTMGAKVKRKTNLLHTISHDPN